MSCVSIHIERKGAVVVSSLREGMIFVSASAVCAVRRSDKVALKDRDGVFLLDSTGAWLFASLPIHSHPKMEGEYLYSVNYSALDYDYAREYFTSHNPNLPYGGCTAVRSGGFVGRNLDWFYGRDVEFYVNNPRIGDLWASHGIAGMVPGLTKSVVEAGGNEDLYRLLPFFMLDGENEHGLFCETNVVPNDLGPNLITVPDVEERDRICSVQVVRYILDHFQTAQEAVNYLKDYVAIYPSKTLQDMGYEAHYLIADSEHTYVLEIVDNKAVFKESRISTNYLLHGVTPNADGKVWTPADAPEHLASDNGITPLGSGLERYNYAVEHIGEADTKVGMRTLMNNLLYSRAYLSAPVVADPVWHTEYVGILTVDSPAADFAETEARYAELFRHRDRDTPATEPRTWHTTHSCVYDLENKKLYVVSQEDTTKEYEFNL